MKKNRLKIFVSVILLTAIFLFVMSPKENIEACLKGLVVWATALVPALLPFFFFTKILSQLGIVEYASRYLAKFTQKFFHTSGISAYIYCMSILSGYPMGAKLTADYFEAGLIDRGQAHRITTFTSTSGPLFIIGTVGIGMFQNFKLGLIILIAHFIGAFINGILYRNYMYKPEKNVITYSYQQLPQKTKNILEESMMSTIQSMLVIGGYVALFFTVITILNRYHILAPIQIFLKTLFDLIHIPTGVATGITNGIIEITKGCLDLVGSTGNISLICILLTGIISFGGISIACQALTFLKKFKIKVSFFLLQKTTHAMISMFVCFIITLFVF